MKVLQIIDGEIYAGIYEIMLRFGNVIKNIEFNYLTSVKVYDSPKSFDLGISRKNLKSKIIYNYRLYKFLKKNKYDIVHISSGAFFFTFFCVLSCKLAGVKNVIVHSRNTPKIKPIKKLLIKILNPIYRKMTAAHLSCSVQAAKSLFTKTDDVIILKNGIDTDKYRFDKKIRDEYRKKLNIEKKIVYGHIGRFSYQKNHDFLIDLFYEIQKNEDAVLLLIGTGELEDKIKEKVNKLNIDDKVMFLEFRNDVDKLLNVFDMFLFPSFYEGLGNVVIESLTNGISTFVSAGVPEEANISNNFHKIDGFDVNKWIEEIQSAKKYNRENAYKDTIKKGYDINTVAKELEKIYKDLIK